MPEILGIKFDDPATMVQNALSGLTTTIDTAKNSVTSWVTDIFGRLGSAVTGFFGGIGSWVKGIVTSAFKALFGAIKLW